MTQLRNRSLFLDEPTSGLDSAIAAEVMQCIKELQLSTGCTLLVTIHQPSPGARRGMLVLHVLRALTRVRAWQACTCCSMGSSC